MSERHPLASLLSALGHGKVDILPPADVGYLDRLLLDGSLVRVLPAASLSAVPLEHMRLWCHQQAAYGLPTTELVDWLRARIAGRRAIEIGAGNDSLGRALGIPCTDSRMQERPEIAAHYRLMGQAVIAYPADVEKLDALEAVAEYKPEVVIGSWITHRYRADEHERGGNAYGVDEDALLDAGMTYIHIGATTSHDKKRILSRPHEKFRFDWLAGRGESRDRVIWVWNGSGKAR